MIAIAALIVMLAVMLIEWRVSTVNERQLETLGAMAAADPVYPVMRIAYPGLFVLMAAEGAIRGGHWRLAAAGAVVLVAAKVLKVWAVASLGGRWTYRVFVLPGAPLVTGGPYRWVRHPNYIAVIGELIGFALVVTAPVTGAIALLGFGELLRRRIRAEEEALEIR